MARHEKAGTWPPKRACGFTPSRWPDNVQEIMSNVRRLQGLMQEAGAMRIAITTSQQGLELLRARLGDAGEFSGTPDGGTWLNGIPIHINPLLRKLVGIKSRSPYYEFDLSDRWAVFAGLADEVWQDDFVVIDTGMFELTFNPLEFMPFETPRVEPDMRSFVKRIALGY